MEDGAFAVFVFAALNRASAHQIDRTSEQLRKLLLHYDPVQKGWVGMIVKSRQQVDVAVIAKIRPESRAKQVKPGDSAIFAESANLLAIDIQQRHATQLAP